MGSELRPVSVPHTHCKCCGSLANLYGVVDFHKNCEAVRQKVLDLSGIPLYYHRCPSCGLIFTIAFDSFTPEDFARHIYNPEYALVDQDYKEVRPRSNAQFIASLFAGTKDLRILDYGGGSGLLAELLRDAGFFSVQTYDPFVPRHAARPTEQFDLILCFEVAEHAPRPAETFAEINSLLVENGLILFSTLLQPPNMQELGVSWWYLAPRNGHVCLYTREALLHLVRPMGFQLGSYNSGMHLMVRRIPEFAKHFLTAT